MMYLKSKLTPVTNCPGAVALIGWRGDQMPIAFGLPLRKSLVCQAASSVGILVNPGHGPAPMYLKGGEERRECVCVGGRGGARGGSTGVSCW